MSMRPVAKGRDAGFSLVELLIVISLLGILMTALALTMSTMMAQTAASQTRVEDSHDAQLASAYFSEDVASTGVRATDGSSLQSIETNAPATGGLYPCGPVSLPNAVVRLAWDELTDGSAEVRTRVVVSYVVVPTGSERQLRRVMCRVTPAPSSPTATAAAATTVVAHNVSATTAPTLSCSAACTTPSVTRVSLNLTIAQPDSSDALTVTLTGQRRQT